MLKFDFSKYNERVRSLLKKRQDIHKSLKSCAPKFIFLERVLLTSTIVTLCLLMYGCAVLFVKLSSATSETVTHSIFTTLGLLSPFYMVPLYFLASYVNKIGNKKELFGFDLSTGKDANKNNAMKLLSHSEVEKYYASIQTKIASIDSRYNAQLTVVVRDFEHIMNSNLSHNLPKGWWDALEESIERSIDEWVQQVNGHEEAVEMLNRKSINVNVENPLERLSVLNDFMCSSIRKEAENEVY